LFQAEAGLRDYKVTGVQTCALPIWLGYLQSAPEARSSLMAEVADKDGMGLIARITYTIIINACKQRSIKPQVI